MTTEANKALVRRWVAAINTQYLAELDAVLSPTLAQEWKETLIPWIYSTFASHHVEVEEMLAEGDRVALWLATSDLLVGHSFAGLPLRLFAHQFPHEVVMTHGSSKNCQ